MTAKGAGEPPTTLAGVAGAAASGPDSPRPDAAWPERPRGEAGEGLSDDPPAAVAPPGGTPRGGGPAAACANCGATLVGRYCATCGQEARGLDRRLREVLVEWAGDLFAFDSRLARTLHRLLRPGTLSREVWEGRRARHVPAVRLYLFASLLFFLVVGWLDLPLVKMNVTEGGSAGASGLVVANPSPEELAQLAEQGFAGRALAAAFDDPAGFERRLLDRLSLVLFLLVPVLASLLQLLVRRPRRFWLEHLVFALHVQTFGFIAIAVAALLDRLLATDAVGILALLSAPAYFALALRGAYGLGWARAAVVTTAVGVGYCLAAALAMLALVATTALVG